MNRTLLRQLRFEQSLSIAEIAKITNKAKSSISWLCAKYGLKPRNPKRLKTRMAMTSPQASRIMQDRWHSKRVQALAEANTAFCTIKQSPLLMLFLGLYWGEGRKYGSLRLTNNDPTMIKAVYGILKRCVGDVRVNLVVYYYPEHNPKLLQDWWQTYIGIKPAIKPVPGKNFKKTRKLGKAEYGQAVLHFNDWKLQACIYHWIKCLGSDIDSIDDKTLITNLAAQFRHDYLKTLPGKQNITGNETHPWTLNGRPRHKKLCCHPRSQS